MNKHLWLIVVVCGLGLLACPRPGEAAPPLNFKVSQMVDSSNEGPDRTRTFFTMGAHRIAFEQPAKTEMNSTAEAASIFFSNRGPQGQLTVCNSKFPASLDFVSGVQTYFEEAEGSLPPEAKDIVSQGSDYKVYAVSSRTCLALDWTYTLFGREIHYRMAYINIDAEHQVRLTVISSEDSWKGASALARGFMNSWFFADDMKGRDVTGSY